MLQPRGIVSRGDKFYVLDAGSSNRITQWVYEGYTIEKQ